jgi:DNA invertase Pin-like site-specific DNA recombinase
MNELEEGDTVVIYQLEHLFCSVRILKNQLKLFQKNLISLISIQDKIDTNESNLNFYKIIDILNNSDMKSKTHQANQLSSVNHKIDRTF